MKTTTYFKLLVTVAVGMMAPPCWLAVGLLIQGELDARFLWALGLGGVATGLPLATSMVHYLEGSDARRRRRPKNWQLVRGGLSTEGDDIA